MSQHSCQNQPPGELAKVTQLFEKFMHNTMDTTKHDDYQSILLAPRYNLNIRINGQNHFLLNLIQLEFSLAGHEIQVECHCKSSLFLTSL